MLTLRQFKLLRLVLSHFCEVSRYLSLKHIFITAKFKKHIVKYVVLIVQNLKRSLISLMSSKSTVMTLTTYFNNSKKTLEAYATTSK